MKILVLNAGSSSYKLALYSIDRAVLQQPQPPIWSCVCTWKEGDTNAQVETFTGGVKTLQTLSNKSPESALKKLIKEIPSSGIIESLSEIDAIGHRVVHGGSAFTAPARITPKVHQAIKSLFPLAPLHNPINLAGIDACQELMPTTPQIAVFDTAFHTTLPETASTYPGPYEWKAEGIKRYGFHGISHQYCALKSAALLKKEVSSLKIVSCHLGNGSSLTAIDKGKSSDTTMGFTPIDGLMMGSRSGALDPGILIYLNKAKGLSIDKLSHQLNYDSGLKGISGFSSDMRDIMRLKAEGNAKAKLAYDMYVLSLKHYVGAMVGALGGIDTLIFTAGIGENVPQIRQECCEAFAQLGIVLDQHKNTECHPDAIISAHNSKVAVLVIRTEEDWSIAYTCWKLTSKH